MKHNYISFFDYVDWNEDIIISTLKDKYSWETAGDTADTWRVGDGSTAFYNYIYYRIAGFTEHDTFRSNLIRDGKLTREEAIGTIDQSNRPRWDSMEDYASRIGFDLEHAIEVINNVEPHY